MEERRLFDEARAEVKRNARLAESEARSSEKFHAALSAQKSVDVLIAEMAQGQHHLRRKA
eukprot:CAMPEP_0170435756 /NCGR_PEP_ID=MMETSP0117_2-20130122/43773_1 /TAXON_ID=400756 /ORGANISM="Durinskia baltica, Strain CSIRO CS-38" /LENGTH=59 /DNA_ID=CAMNT_0010695737 /DNA_START=176 /DNA_END=355 /DNA_ORIENTATION=+